jgi:hypothetical protein
MKIELFIFCIIAFLIYDMYNKQKYTKMLFSYKKYCKPLFWIFSILCMYFYIKKQPTNGQNLLLYANNIIKSLPIDRSTLSTFSPIIDFTQGKGFMEKMNEIQYAKQNTNTSLNMQPQEKLKRSVSETKKKFVASQQGWKCNECKEQLNAWFEVDHVIRLEYGGGNGLDNLVALCRECHGRKTAMENM